MYTQPWRDVDSTNILGMFYTAGPLLRQCTGYRFEPTEPTSRHIMWGSYVV